MRFIQIPHFTISPAAKEHIANAQEHPLSVCSVCLYVQCGCGGCHSKLCAQPCGYEVFGGGSGGTSLDLDGKTWCEACGGNYLPHEH